MRDDMIKLCLSIFVAYAAGLSRAVDVFDLCQLDEAETFFFSAENPRGERGGGNARPNCKDSPKVVMEPGSTVTMADVDGPGRIEHIWIGGANVMEFILRMYWDEQDRPAVEVPLAAFFGNGYPENHRTVEDKYICLDSALMLTSPHVGCNSYIPMPFRRHARITLENRAPRKMETYYAITGSRGPQGKDIGYFHAQYRKAQPVESGKPYVILDGVKGRGRFIGVTLAAGVNGPGRCWVEGEVRMFLDGEATPTLQYTGTEDYFCGSYAFGNDHVLRKYQVYSGLYAGMYGVFGEHCGTGKDQHRFLLYRWHVKDPIRFRKGFRMTIDNILMPGARPRTDDFATVAYWYEDN